MTHLRKQLKEDYIAAFKARDTVRKNLLGTLKGEIESNDKKPEFKDGMTDEQILKLIGKYKTNSEENLKVYTNPDAIAKTKKEIEILSAYLPNMLSEEDLSKVVDDLLSSGMNNIGQIMGALKKQYGATVDMGMASKMVKERL